MHKFYGTLSESENAPTPSGVFKVIPKNKKKSIYSHILSSDVVIFDLNLGSADDIESIVKLIKEESDGLHKEIQFILVSSVMSWAGTQPKVPAVAKSQEDGQHASDEEELT